MKTKLLIFFAVLIVLSAFLVDPISQDPTYHLFADGRRLLAVDNFWNTISNLPFLVGGLAGLYFLRRRTRAGLIDSLYPAYLVFFMGVTATGIGSAWYHLVPANETLVWDRLPMTIAFMALFAIVMGEHVCDRGARRMLIPLLAVGAASVFYWQYTETQGAGDLRPYALVQFLPLLLIPMILVLYEPKIGSGRVYWSMLVLYAASKIFEQLDASIFDFHALLSGHTLKHIFAGIAPLVYLAYLRRRTHNHGLHQSA